jgi:peptidyl-prolyl cis-trans isomerase SurA
MTPTNARRYRHSRISAWGPLFAACLCAALATWAAMARATIVERVVAVIGDRPVLWTELVHRAAAARIQIRLQTRDPNVVSVQEQEMYKELLDRMIDDRLEEQQADKAHLGVTQEEIDRGISNIAAQAQPQQGHSVSVSDVLAEVQRRGMTEQDFRDEIRRQIIEGKLIELRVRPRVRVTEQDAHAAYQHFAQEAREQQPVDVRILALRIQPTATSSQILARRGLAQELAARARRGEDFCKLVTDFSVQRRCVHARFVRLAWTAAARDAHAPTASRGAGDPPGVRFRPHFD